MQSSVSYFRSNYWEGVSTPFYSKLNETAPLTSLNPYSASNKPLSFKSLISLSKSERYSLS